MGLFSSVGGMLAAVNPVAAIGTLASGGMDYLMADKAQDFERDETRAARRWQEEQTRQANEYNTPKNQMARLQDAGLNPRLIYDKVNNMGWQSVASPEIARPQRVTVGDKLFNFMELRNMGLQGNILAEQARAAKSNADFTIYENKKIMERGGTRTDATLVKEITGVLDLFRGAGRWWFNNMRTSPAPESRAIEMPMPANKKW